MKTVIYLVRHAATEANLAQPALLQGRRLDPPLAALGVRQAELTRDLLAGQRFDACYCSPLQRALQTAALLSLPHQLTPRVFEDLTECDIGAWEGLDWQTIRHVDPERYQQFMTDPAQFGYPGGESFADVHRRASAFIDELFERHQGQSLLVVSHRIVNRTCLAVHLGLSVAQARNVSLDNCGISVVEREGSETRVVMLNSTFHLRALAA